VRAPEFIFAGNVAQRLEGNGYLDDPTVVRHAALRFHYDVRIEIFAVVGPTAIGLYPERIEIKLIGFASVVESVEQNADVIVVEDVVPLGDGRANFVRLVVTMKGDVDEFRIAPEKYFGWFRGRDVVTGLDLIEIFGAAVDECAALLSGFGEPLGGAGVTSDDWAKAETTLRVNRPINKRSFFIKPAGRKLRGSALNFLADQNQNVFGMRRTLSLRSWFS
jgi:hypothetical protein